MNWLKKAKLKSSKIKNKDLYKIDILLAKDQCDEFGISYNKSKGRVKVKPIKEHPPTLTDVINILNVVAADVKVLKDDMIEVKADIKVLKADIKDMKNTPTMKHELEEMKKAA